jgi:hypothetical protein
MAEKMFCGPQIERKMALRDATAIAKTEKTGILNTRTSKKKSEHQKIA